jgi:replicative DNA helicase
MTSIHELLTPEVWAAPPGRAPVLAGVADFDELTGGLRPGALWAVTGVPGVGRSMFLAQLARRAAVTVGARTRLLSARDPASSVVQHLLAGQGRVPLHRLRAGRLTNQDEQRLGEAREELRAAPLEVVAADRSRDLPSPDRLLAEDPPDVLLIDDLDLWSPPDSAPLLRRLRAYARDTAASVVVTAPDVAPDDAPLAGLVRESLWARLPDLLLRLHRPELSAHDSPRAGEMDLVVLRHRVGPVATITCAFQGYYARVVDLDPPAVADHR